ncbi:MAG: nitroreductase family protein [Candidatus Bathyarchaeota archaeon]|nr:nitroreductase family protein [Candidatus Bathyarchaeota archaeon]
MNVSDAIINRRSIRSYKKQDLPQATIETLLEAARQAPSAGNIQPWSFIVAATDKTKQAISEAAFGQRSLQQAAIVIVVCADEKRAAEGYGERGRTLYCIQDTAAAIQNILLTACSLGLGSCWIGAFKEDAVRKVINAPKGMRPVALLPIGFPNEAPEPRLRRPLSEIVHWEKF